MSSMPTAAQRLAPMRDTNACPGQVSSGAGVEKQIGQAAELGELGASDWRRRPCCRSTGVW